MASSSEPVVAADDEHEVIAVSLLTKGVEQNDVLEVRVLSRYGTYDRLRGRLGQCLQSPQRMDLASPKKKDHYIINGDVTDANDVTTVSLHVYNEVVCDMFNNLIHPRKHLCIRGFELKKRNTALERGDLDWLVNLTSKTTVELIPDFPDSFLLRFFPTNKVAQFRKKAGERYAYADLAGCMYDCGPQRPNLLSVKVADSLADADKFVLDMEPNMRQLYDSLMERVNHKEAPLLLLKKSPPTRV